MLHTIRYSLLLTGILSAVALVSVFVVTTAQTPPKSTSSGKSPVPSASDQRPQQSSPAKPGAPPAAKSNPPTIAPSGTQSNTSSSTPPMPPDPDVNTKYDDIKFATFMLDEDTNMMSGTDFTFTRDDMVVTGKKAQHNNDTLVLDAEGNLVVDDLKHHVTGDKAHIERKKALAVITGNVVIVLKPEEAPANGAAPAPPETKNDRQQLQEDKKRGGTITCDRMDDYYKREFSILNGHLVFKQRILRKNGEILERTLTSEHAEYNGKEDRLVLFKPVSYSDSKGQKIETEDNVVIGTKEGAETITFNGPAKARVVRQENDDAGDDNKTPAKPDSKTPQTPQKSDKSDNKPPDKSDKT